MSILVGIRHTTTYKFDRRVSLSPHLVRLRPAPHSRTPIVSYSMNIRPKDYFINWLQDPFSNYIARLVFPEKTTELVIDVDLVADMTAYNPFDFFVEESAGQIPFEYPASLRTQLAPFLETKDWGPYFKKYLASMPRKHKNTVHFLSEVNMRMCKDIAYTIRLEPGVQTPEHTLHKALGSCRDTAWLLVQLLRHLGIASRFVSGYLVQLTSDQKSLDGPSGPENDFTDLHAWVEAYIPGAGWVGFDPTSGLFAAEGHIPLSCTPQPSDAAPIMGATDECEVEFSYSNEVTRLKEDPRVTKPFSDNEWNAIDALGHAIDAELAHNDVRLTMGGEPTFVSIDDMESAQWNTAADGEHKRMLALDLTQRLRGRFAPNALMHYGQGKWYPGEPLPRWQYALYWRKDGEPMWALPIAAEEKTPLNLSHARRFVDALAEELTLHPALVQSAFEDPFHHLWQHGQLPIDFKLSDKSELGVRTLSQVLERGLNMPAGYVLPLAWDPWRWRWQSCRWVFRQGGLYLLPGNSPIGMRLPLSSLAGTAKDDLFDVIERDPFDESGAPKRHATTLPYSDDMIADMAIHTALCCEIRDGALYLFLPPLSFFEHYQRLINAIAAVSKQLNIIPRIEGYSPPPHASLTKLVVAPDPGVIEVNIQPAASWTELKRITETLYEEARLARLGTDKFMLDGRHSGTGGGNHVTLGGATPSDSPLLRRPHLLRSLLTFWQHHPSLSYLFSGMFIGPTSQAPRVDESRDERLYELDIAFKELDKADGSKPWLVDRLLRNLLTDLTGNTHRSEFCIDKLYSPDGPTGRLGILEFRSFEMPPHPRMSLVQMLLLRAAVALFWNKPYKEPVTHWGDALHDRFMLPYYMWQDLSDVIGFFNRNGYNFKLDWFKAFLEFRCPRIGTMQLEGMEVEMHHALEPWHVLGEETTAQGTSRYVDSSLERLQVTIKNATPERFVLTCNGISVPLIQTRETGTFVAGVRYKAWAPPSALHPTIGVHTPLVFDLFDTWNNRSLGGCTYHVMHPGGRNYETFPVNALEAEARRIARFENLGHHHGTWVVPPASNEEGTWLQQAGGTTAGHLTPHAAKENFARPVAAKPNPRYPCTLDLRHNNHHEQTH